MPEGRSPDRTYGHSDGCRAVNLVLELEFVLMIRQRDHEQEQDHEHER